MNIYLILYVIGVILAYILQVCLLGLFLWWGWSIIEPHTILITPINFIEAILIMIAVWIFTSIFSFEIRVKVRKE